MRNAILSFTILCSLLVFASCEQDEVVAPIPAEGSFILHYEGENIFLESIAPAPHKNKFYTCETTENIEFEISNPTCGGQKDITEIQYEIGRDALGKMHYGSYKTRPGDKIKSKEIYRSKEENKIVLNVLQVTVVDSIYF